MKDYYTKSGITGIARMIAPLVEVFNDNRSDPLPKYIIMLPDNDIISSLKSKVIHTALVMGSTLHYLICQIDMLIDRHTQELIIKKPGAVLPDYPKVVWVRMLKRPAADMNNSNSYREKFYLHGKFNSILEERLFDGKAEVHRIISIDVPPDEFDRLGNLTSAGKTTFWLENNRGMYKFDTDKIKLKPCKGFNPVLSEQNDSRSHMSSPQQRRRLPAPPDRSLSRRDRTRERSSSHRHHGHGSSSKDPRDTRPRSSHHRPY